MTQLVPQEPGSRSAVRERHSILGGAFRQPGAVLAACFLIAVVLACSFAPLLTSYDPTANDLTATLLGPGLQHPLGTDQLGRDTLSRLLYGGRLSLIGVLEAISVAVVIGIPTGLLSGYFGGWVDALVSRCVEIAMAIPAIILVLMALAVFGQSQNAAMIVLGALFSPGLTRVTRATTISVREELYVAAAKTSGLTPLQIIRHHIFPSIAGPVTINTALLTASALLAQTGLSFLGFGVTDPQPSWGGMVAASATTLNQQPFSIVPAGGIIALTCLALILLGDSIRDADRAKRGASARIGRRSAAVTRSPSVPGAGATARPASPFEPEALLVVDELSIEMPLPAGWTTVVDRVGFSIRPGETVGLVGESGSGKTVTALALLSLIPGRGRVSSGRVVFKGRELALRNERDMRAIRGNGISYIAQEPMVSLDPSFTIGNQMTEVVLIHERCSRRAARTRVLELLAMAGISDPVEILRLYPHQVSGGMAQRVAIARSLAGRPSLLIADEPTTALDATTQAGILDLLRGLIVKTGMAMILVTHDWGVVADICDRAVVMYAGEVVEDADVVGVFRRPLHPYTGALLRANPHLVLDGARILTIHGRVPAPGDWPVGCHFAARCALARPDCRAEGIPLRQVTVAHFSRCLHVEELVAGFEKPEPAVVAEDHT